MWQLLTWLCVVPVGIATHRRSACVCYAKRDADTDTHTDRYGEAFADANGNPDQNQNAYPHAHTCTDRNTRGHAVSARDFFIAVDLD